MDEAQLRVLREELHTLLHSWEYASAMGSSCMYDPHPGLHGVRRRVDDLRALIKEHSS